METSDLLLVGLFVVVALAWWLSFALEDKPHTKFDEPDEHVSSLGLPHTRRKGVRK